MTGGANAVGVAMIDIEPSVIEGCAQPTGSRVADSAGIGEPCRDVIRTVCSLIVRLMAAETISGQSGVVVVDVTFGTVEIHMRPGQGERCVVVVERRRGPRRSVMADVALLGQVGGNVVRVVCTLKVFEVATDAGGAGQVVIVVGMALTALHIGMGAGERPSGSRVIEGCGSPIRSAVARLALLRETSGHVIGILSCLEFCQMATHTSCGGQVVVAIGVTLRT